MRVCVEQMTVESAETTAAASEVTRAVLDEMGVGVDPATAPGATEFEFVIGRTLLQVKRLGRVRIEPAGAGSRVTVTIRNHPGQPNALLDGWFHRRLLARIGESLTAGLSA